MALSRQKRPEVLPGRLPRPRRDREDQILPVAKLADEWIETYIAAERRGNDSLRRFLLDLDAKEANGNTGGQTIDEVIQLYFAFNAPDTADGLVAQSTN